MTAIDIVSFLICAAIVLLIVGELLARWGTA